MFNKIKEILSSNRMKSLYWRTVMMIIAIVVSSLISSLEMFESILSPQVAIFLGLVLGEVSKALNNSLSR